MYAAHDAFHRDLRRLAAAVEAGRTADPAVRAGWATFKNQLHVHHTTEDEFLWPALRAKVTQPGDVAVLDVMQAEHAGIDPLLSRVDVSLAAADGAGLVENTWGPTAGPRPGRPPGRARVCGAGAELFPWMLDGAPADTSKRVLGMLPPPARLIYRAVWRPGYTRHPALEHRHNLTRADRPQPATRIHRLPRRPRQ